jgi:hypothetical protein
MMILRKVGTIINYTRNGRWKCGLGNQRLEFKQLIKHEMRKLEESRSKGQHEPDAECDEVLVDERLADSSGNDR